jgi:two-component system, cell cycle response regulator DivK
MRGKAILLVDDDRDSRTVLGAVLRRSGFHVLEAEDGAEGVVLAQLHLPHLIVMDLGLPTLDGWRATDALKSNPLTAHIPVVAVSIHVQEFYRGRAAAVGCHSFLEKPCSPAVLVDEIRRILGAS